METTFITMFFEVVLLWYHFQKISATYVISVYGDVHQDQEFFTRTYPWVIDNIGGEITVDYYLLGSGRYSVPQMCALNEMRINTFLQAQYLKCEAEGNHSEVCLCATGIDPQKYKQCVLTKGSLASMSASKYDQLGLDAQPVIEIGYKNTIFGVEDTWYLKKICTIFGDSPPRGCIKPFACNATGFYTKKRGAANFNCERAYFANVSFHVTYRDEMESDPVIYTTDIPYMSTTSTAPVDIYNTWDKDSNDNRVN